MNIKKETKIDKNLLQKINLQNAQPHIGKMNILKIHVTHMESCMWPAHALDNLLICVRIRKKNKNIVHLNALQ